MLENAYFRAKISADTAENEQHFAENLPKIGNCPTGPPLRAAGCGRPLERRRRLRSAAAGPMRGLGEACSCLVVGWSGNVMDPRSDKLDRAHSRLYRGQILQENMRLKALAEIYTMHSFAHLCNFNFLSKITFLSYNILPNSANLAKF